MNYLIFCREFNYDQRSDMARESFDCFKLFYGVITNKKVDSQLLAFLGIKNYAKHAAKR